MHSSKQMGFHFFLFFGMRSFLIFLAVIALQWIISHFDIPSAGGHLLASSNTDHGWTAAINFGLVIVFILLGASIGSSQIDFSHENRPSAHFLAAQILP